MKLSFAKDQLAFATATTQSVANPQSSLPILGNTLISAREGEVVFEASDMESCVRCTIKAEVADPGSIAIDSRRLHSIVRDLPDGDVEISVEATQATIKTGEKVYHLTTQSPEDFPTWPELQAATTLTLEQAVLHRILSKVLYSLPQKDPRKVLLGAFFDLNDNELVCVGTDGKKLGLSRCDVPEVNGTQPTSAIIPQKILHEIERNLESQGTVRLLLGERQVAFEMGNLIYLSNRIDGIYPSYQSVVPAEFNRFIKLPRAAFINEVISASKVSEEHNNSIVMRFEPGKVTFQARNHEVGSYRGALNIDYDGDAFDIAFNHVYLTESFRVIESAEVTMKVKENTAPVVFVEPENEKSLYLVMPIKLTDVADLNLDE